MMKPTEQATGLVFACIAPHGGMIVPELAAGKLGQAARTRAAMEELGRRMAAAAPETLVVITPHGVRVGGMMCIAVTERAAGELSGDEGRTAARIALDLAIDRDLAYEIAATAHAKGVPVGLAGYGSSSGESSCLPLDWGALIPLWHVQRHAPDIPAVLVSPARELDADSHVRAGAAIVRAAAAMSRRIAFIASADQGHGHDPAGRYGYHAESAVFDGHVADIVRRGALDELIDIPREDVVSAVADSWWQMLMLVGAMRESGAEYDCELLAYEAPTYYGMLTAVVTPRP